MRNAADDCQRIADVCENPDNYNSDTTGIRQVIYQGARKVHDLKHAEVWEARFFVQWISDLATSPVYAVEQCVITVADIAALSATSVLTYTNGKQAFVEDTGKVFVLRDALSGSPDGKYIVATFDDATLQWVDIGLTEGTTFSIMSDSVNMKTVGDTVLLPPMEYRFSFIDSALFEILTTDTCTVAPTLSIGTDSPAFANIYTAQTTAAWTTGVQYGRVSPATTASPLLFQDLSTSGLKLRVSVGATATALTARLFWTGRLAPL
jgi:hypothetical protein